LQEDKGAAQVIGPKRPTRAVLLPPCRGIVVMMSMMMMMMMVTME
jgi:hypothetical protein